MSAYESSTGCLLTTEIVGAGWLPREKSPSRPRTPLPGYLLPSFRNGSFLKPQRRC